MDLNKKSEILSLNNSYINILDGSKINEEYSIHPEIENEVSI
jgi:hypothetical protein